MSRFLFTLWVGGGTIPPELSIARALLARGHEVRVLADAALAADVRAAGAEHVPWATAPQRTRDDVRDAVVPDWEARSPLGAFSMLRERLLFGPAARYAADTRAELDRWPADAVAASFALLG